MSIPANGICMAVSAPRNASIAGCCADVFAAGGRVVATGGSNRGIETGAGAGAGAGAAVESGGVKLAGGIVGGIVGGGNGLNNPGVNAVKRPALPASPRPTGGAAGAAAPRFCRAATPPPKS